MKANASVAPAEIDPMKPPEPVNIIPGVLVNGSASSRESVSDVPDPVNEVENAPAVPDAREAVTLENVGVPDVVKS